MPGLPAYIPLSFTFNTFITIALFYFASRRSKLTLVLIICWLILQSTMAISGFYRVADTIPPRFILLVGPPLALVAGLFFSHSGRKYLDTLDLKTMTLLHMVRVPVEIVLFWVYLHSALPGLMTFEGRNFDILSGLTAPFVYYFGFTKKGNHRSFLIVWNLLCLGLLINVVAHAAMSLPSPFQKLAFDQPNVAVLYFPFNWLPGCVLPLVFLCHLAALRQLLAIRPQSLTNRIGQGK